MFLPKFLQSCFWSYNLKNIDIKNDKQLIIQQILNYGNWQALCWLFDNYSKRDIVKAIKNPLRGRWFKQILDYWSFIFDLKISWRRYQKAVFDIKPNFR